MGWSQPELAKKLGTSQNAISRLEKPDYGKASLTTLKKLAAIYDVGLIVRFAPFGKLLDWESNTPYTDHGLSPEAMNPATFDEEEQSGSLDRDADEPQAHHEWASSETPRGNELRAVETPSGSSLQVMGTPISNELSVRGLSPSTKYASGEESAEAYRREARRRPRKGLTNGKRRIIGRSAVA